MCLFIPPQIITSILANASKFKAETVQSFLDMSTSPIQTGAFSLVRFLNEDGKSRTVYDAEERTHLPGKVTRAEGSEPVSDDIVNRAYDYSGNTWDFFKKVLSRNSLDNRGMHLHATIHYGSRYPNAFYNGKQIAFGDGDGEIFNNFCLIDIMGHELGHGVVDHTANLTYRNQSGALNEHYADVFGMCVKQYELGQDIENASWIVGEGIFTPKINGVGIRSFKNPGSAFNDPDTIGADRQPAHMKDIYTGGEDLGGVHINSGIPNKMFYEFCKNIGGISYGKPVKIWYETLSTKLNSGSNFQEMVNATQEVIISNYGTGEEYRAFKEAAKCVGLVPRHPIFNQLGLTW